MTPATQATAWRFDAGTRIVERRDEVHGRPILFGGSVYTTKGLDIVRYAWGSASEKIGELAPKHDSLEWVGPTFTVQQQHYFGQPTSERDLTVVTDDGFTAGAGSTYDCGDGGPGVTPSGVLYDGGGGVRSFDPAKHEWTQLTSMTSLPFGAIDRGGANDCELFGSDLINGNVAAWVPGAPTYTTIATGNLDPVIGPLAGVVTPGRYAVVWRRGPTSSSNPLYNGLTGFLR